MAREVILTVDGAKYAIHFNAEGDIVQVDGFKAIRGGGFNRRVLFRDNSPIDLIGYHMAKLSLQQAIYLASQQGVAA
jgi:hypothetical protein